jgi:ubiquinone/menaquinone biosynthesis C-methylase UbiE
VPRVREEASLCDEEDPVNDGVTGSSRQRRNQLTQAFDPIADSYDQWYDTAEGRAIFGAESACLRRLGGPLTGRWLEVGVGSGRFASTLGVAEGVDPSPRMLEIAARRGIRTYAGRAEDLPFPGGSFDGVLLALALCFVADSTQALKECHRVLRSKGRLLLGIVPADSPWGSAYMEKASDGHPVYVMAQFRTAAEIVGLAESAGFALLNATSTLFWEPGATPPTEPEIETGIVSEAGFVGLLFERTAAEASSGSDLEEHR